MILGCLERVGLLVDARDKKPPLAAIRDLLLPKLMSGEIRLKDVEAVV
ncbi:hypothetical protein [Hoeflea alexandrii]